MQAPDIVFIVLDTQRADRLGCYGHSRPISPNLDAFAAQSQLFERAVSPAQWTIPSHASMFTGLYPTAHGVTQSSFSLSPGRPHLAEALRATGYKTVGFCNNPLVGILDNGLKRGFDTFYNYGGAFPSLPRNSNYAPRPFKRIAEAYTQFLRRISYPIQNFFGQSDLAFRVSLNAWLTPLWSRLANFKGQNERSVNDVVWYLQEIDKKGQGPKRRPQFLFLNLMETHLPFSPPKRYMDHVAPYFRENTEAREILQRWNREAYRWAAPLKEPLPELESKVLSDAYDAEVAYQDDYLGPLLDYLQKRPGADNTLTIIVADHGDGLGDHGFSGHAFVAYDELIHVPMMIRWPSKWSTPTRHATPVSTRRVFHTILDAATPAAGDDAASVLPKHLDLSEVRRLSLRHTLAGKDPEQGTAYAEIYPPLNFVKAIERREPELLEQFRCLDLRRAAVRRVAGLGMETTKLINIEGSAEELYRLDADPLELSNELGNYPETAAAMDQLIAQMASRTEHERLRHGDGEAINIDDDKLLQQQLRGLGYLD